MTHYTNITLIDVEQTEIAGWLAENGYTAAVSPEIELITVIYDNVLADHADDDEPIEALLKLASEISYELDCFAWLVIVDEDVMIYSFYANGEIIDSYGVKTGETPEGGDAETLADTFGIPKRTIKTIRGILYSESITTLERHQKLVATLDIPDLAIGIGYADIKNGIFPPGVESIDDLILIEPDEA